VSAAQQKRHRQSLRLLFAWYSKQLNSICATCLGAEGPRFNRTWVAGGGLYRADSHLSADAIVMPSETVKSGGSMHITAFAPSTQLAMNEGGGVNANGFPMTSAHVDSFPQQISIPLVIAAYTQGGSDYDPNLYVVATSPEGDRIGTMKCAWHWPDKPPSPVKFWVLARHLPILVQSPGVYTIGLYDSPDATETEHQFPLPVVKFNPLLPPRN
jgi:hypothetical protein